MNYQHWLSNATAQLAASDSPKREAEILLGHVTGRARTWLLAFGETQLEPAQLDTLSQLLARRIAGEPIAYLVGMREFWSLPLAVSPVTLIPRPDTECLVEQALQRIPAGACQIVDLGTGTGAIALALASECPTAQVIGIDLQPAAVQLAQENAQRLAINNVRFLAGDWFTPVNGQRFAVIVSNPPYIDADDIHLSQGDVRFEPRSALVAEAAGMADLQHIIQHAPQYLLAAGWILLEHGWQQAEAVRNCLLARGFKQVATQQDYGGNDRITLGQWP